ncbi:MAG: proline racemase family protein [Kiloniellales bacterium]|nr:proline racemase family protein [Kiloniellales bacterium]
MITAYDVSAVGMTHRIAVGAAPQIKGANMAAKQDYLETHLDGVRQRLICGPSDEPDLIGVLVTEATDPQADVGIIYFVRQGYWAMCGSGTFALGVFLIESGLIEAVEPVTEIVLELASGLMTLRAEVDRGRVRRVSTMTEPVFHLDATEIELPGYDPVPIDIAYCLNYFEPALNARTLGLDVSLENRVELLRVGVAVRRLINERLTLRHPNQPSIDRAVQVQIYDPEPSTAGVDCRCVAIYGEDGFDLTPSGTSTCAHMATKRAKGEMAVGDRFVMESVTGAVIEGTIKADTEVGDRQAIVPEIAGGGTIARLVTLCR